MIVHGDHGTDYELKDAHNGRHLLLVPRVEVALASEWPAQRRLCKHGKKLLIDAFGIGKGNRIAQQWTAQGMERLGEDYVIKRERPEEIAKKEKEKEDKIAAMKLPAVAQPLRRSRGPPDANAARRRRHLGRVRRGARQRPCRQGAARRVHVVGEAGRRARLFQRQRQVWLQEREATQRAHRGV